MEPFRIFNFSSVSFPFYLFVSSVQYSSNILNLMFIREHLKFDTCTSVKFYQFQKNILENIEI